MDKTVADKLDIFFSQFKPLVYKKGETIIRSDETPQGVYCVSKGYVKMVAFFENGKELTINIFKPESFFPMMWAIGDVPNRYYFQALTAVELRRSPKNDFIDFIQKNQDVLFNLNKRVFVGLDGLLANIEMMLSGSAYSRVMATILICARRFGVKKDTSYIISEPRLTHQDIANLSGITRETTSVIMKKLELKNIISYEQRKLVVGDINKLESNFDLDKDNLTSQVII